jgi:CHAT domain-containing protein
MNRRPRVALALALTLAGSLCAAPSTQQVQPEPELAEAQRLIREANAAYNNADTAATTALALRALEIFERLRDDDGIGQANSWLGSALHMGGKDADAAPRYARAMQAFEASGNLRERTRAAYGYLLTGTFTPEDERTLFDRTLDDARALGHKTLQGQLLHHRGDNRFTTGEYLLALKDLEDAIALLQEPDAAPHLGTAYNSLGRLYRAHGQVETALAYQLKALALHEKGRSTFFHMQSLNAVAVTYDHLGDWRNARTYFKRALTLAEKSSTPRIQDFVRANLGTLMANSADDYPEVARMLEGVVARGLDVYPSRRLQTLAYVYLQLGRQDEALTSAQKSLDVCGAREFDCLYALSMRAAVYAARGEDSAALADLRAALAKVEEIRTRLVPADFFKQQFNLAQEQIYSRTIALQVRQKATGDALESSEQARSRAFIDLLASRNLSAPDPAAAAAPVTAHGSTLASVAAAPPAKLADLAATAARLRSTLLVYWVADDSVFIWVVAPDGKVQAAQTNVSRAVLADLVRSTTPHSARVRADAKSWRELYDVLIKPVRGYLPRTTAALVTIVPHGPLSSLPFAALQDARGRYLLEDYTLHYAPAGGVLQFTSAKRHSGARKGNLLLVADPVPPALSRFERPLPRLPGAREETRAIAALVPPGRVTRLEGAKANEVTVRGSVRQKSVLHFATHAIVRDADPFSSFLAVGKTSDADGLLTAQEIYGLTLEADLVVLSACRSGGGRVTGDGIATFARAFMYAGAPSIVASLWDVADEPTNGLVRQLYRSWFAGASKARALRTAQLALLQDLRTGKTHINTPAGLVALTEDPIYWAGFALIGEPE